MNEKIEFPESSYFEKYQNQQFSWPKDTSLSFQDFDKECIKEFYIERIKAIRAIDDLIGNVFESLLRINELNNTIIMFTSDNGFVLGEHNLWKKELAYEEAIRVPLFIRIPEYNSVKYSNELVINNDLAPTILEFADAESGIIMDGRSLVPLVLNSSKIEWRNQFLIEQSTGARTVAPDHYAIRDSTSIYIKFENGFEEYYDLEADPFQLTNQINCNSSTCIKKIEKQRSLLEKIKYCSGETCHYYENQK